MDSAELLQIGKKQNNVFMQSHILLFAGYPLQFLFFGAILQKDLCYSKNFKVNTRTEIRYLFAFSLITPAL